ncbi:specificity protein phosphatase 1 [Seminavis robusta]|uniref:protein-tyrosine-phosphatase n=1 Tax=Seminavis robusta TaxID=568900 RepID=A0A9N8HXX3_9STRA|nr:specificity protein phosphatase 1 [Seminavis robusta]|eukprot:Sro2612_g332600.1 specificity protein phosphatase 1 (223) ;mRNA; f:5622-6290
MGPCLSSSPRSQNTNGNNQDDLQDYVEAIRRTQYLDWRQHIQDEDERQAILQVQRNPPVPILDDLFLSGATSLLNQQRLKSLGITHILNVAGRQATNLEGNQSNDFIYKTIGAADRKDYAMLELHLEECRSFIDSCREMGGKCLVHCQAGANRSGVVVAAEMMLRTQKPVLEVVYHCRKQRGTTFLCNETFIIELVKLAKTHSLLGPKPGEHGCIVATKVSR